MWKEKDFYGHCKKFEYIHDFVKFLWKSVYDPLEFGVLDSNVYLYEKGYYKCSNHYLNEFYSNSSTDSFKSESGTYIPSNIVL